jgi:hypothetical protein
MIERGGAVVIRMLANVQQVTIKPLVQAAIAPGTLVYTDEYDIYSRLVLLCQILSEHSSLNGSVVIHHNTAW